jgi:hypothetical protein
MEHRTPAPILSLSKCSNLVQSINRCCTPCSHVSKFEKLIFWLCSCVYDNAWG